MINTLSISVWVSILMGWIMGIHSVSAERIWSEEDRDAGCIRYQSERQGDLLPVKMVCVWDIPAQQLIKILATPEYYHKCFSRVKHSKRIMGPQSLYRRVYQIHDASPVKDRAVYLDYQLSDQRSQSSPKNFQKFGKWHLAFKRSPPSQELKIGADFVEVQENQGYWEVQDHPQGSQVIMESVYHPGGSVPGFLVRWFLGSGLQKMMDELRECAR